MSKPLGRGAALLVFMALSACAVPPTGKVGPVKRAADDAKAASPSSIPSPLPSTNGSSAPARPTLVLPLRLLPALPASLVGAQSAAMVRQAPLLARDGAVLRLDGKGGLIANDGSGLIANDGSGLIGNDGSGLIANDGSGLIGNDGSGLIANDGAGVVAAGAGNYALLDFGFDVDPAEGGLSWEQRVQGEVQSQASFLMSLTFVVDQLLAKWAQSGPKLGEWGRFSAQTQAFLDAETAVLAPVLATGEGQLRHFAVLAREDKGVLEAAFYLLKAPGDEPDASQQVFTLRTERLGEAQVHFVGTPLFATIPALQSIRLRPEGRFVVNLKQRSLVGEGSVRIGMGHGAEYRSLGERRMRWALKREAQGFAFAGSKVAFRNTVVDLYQNALRVLPNGDGAFWQARGFNADAGAFASTKLQYVSHVQEQVVPLDQAPPAWYLRGDALASGPIPPQLEALFPSPDAAASVPLPTWPRPEAEADAFPYLWQPVP